MAVRIRKVKRKRINGAFVLLVFSLLAFFASRTFLRAYNITLNMKHLENMEIINSLTIERETLLLDVQELCKYDRIIAIVGNSDFEVNVNNVITVGN